MVLQVLGRVIDFAFYSDLAFQGRASLLRWDSAPALYLASSLASKPKASGFDFPLLNSGSHWVRFRLPNYNFGSHWIRFRLPTFQNRSHWLRFRSRLLSPSSLRPAASKPPARLPTQPCWGRRVKHWIWWRRGRNEEDRAEGTLEGRATKDKVRWHGKDRERTG